MVRRDAHLETQPRGTTPERQARFEAWLLNRGNRDALFTVMSISQGLKAVFTMPACEARGLIGDDYKPILSSVVMAGEPTSEGTHIQPFGKLNNMALLRPSAATGNWSAREMQPSNEAELQGGPITVTWCACECCGSIGPASQRVCGINADT
jgi:hypothetical protein